MKYKVSVSNLEYYQELEIEADNETEAEEKYQAMLEQGNVLVVNNDFNEIQVTKI